MPILQDLRLAMARLRAKPSQLFAVSLILALGIGASIAIFTLVDATLFHPFDSSFGLLAVSLAAFGLGALMFQQTQSRTREFGVRLALGARSRSVLNPVLVRGAWMSALGGTLGLAGSLLLAPLVRSFLFDVRPQDPPTSFGAAVVLAMVSGAAAVIPALRASRTDPAAVARSE